MVNYGTILHIKLFLPSLAIGVKLRRWGESGGVGEGGRGGGYSIAINPFCSISVSQVCLPCKS